MGKPTTNPGGFTSQLLSGIEVATFSTFKSCKATKPSGTQSASALIDEVKSDAHKATCDKIRSEPDKDKRSKLKSQLPAVTASGVFSKRSASALDKHSGFLIADIDLDDNKHLEDAKTLSDLRFDLCTSPHVAFLFKSPSGGLKVGFCIDASDHEAAFKTVKYFMKEERDVTIDKSCSDVSRLCFLSHDPQAWYNKTATKLETIEVAEEVAPQAVNQATSKSFDSKKTVVASRPVKPNDIETARSALAAIPPNPDYEVWIKIIAATVAMVGESVAVELLQAWSPEKNADSYTAKVRNGLDSVSAGTLIHIAKEHGWSQPRKKNPAPTVNVDAFRAAKKVAKKKMEVTVKAAEPVKDEKGVIPAYFSQGALKDLYLDIYERSNPRNDELIGAGAIASMAALIGQRFCIKAGPFDKRANSQVIMLGKSGSGKDAPQGYYQKLVHKIYGYECDVTTYHSPTTVQSRLSKTGYCFEKRDEAGDLLNAINAGARSSTALAQIGSMIKELKTSANKFYKGFTESALTEGRTYVTKQPFYVSLSGATPGQYKDATGNSDIEGGFWGRVLLFHTKKSAIPIVPCDIQIPTGEFSSAVLNHISQAMSAVSPEREKWEAYSKAPKEAEAYEPDHRPEPIIFQEAAIRYIYAEVAKLQESELKNDDNDRLECLTTRLQELCYELVLMFAVSKWMGDPTTSFAMDGGAADSDRAIIATLEDAKICWEFTKEQHIAKQGILRAQVESIEDKVVAHAEKICNKSGLIARTHVKTWINRNYRRKITVEEAFEAIADSGKFKLEPNDLMPHWASLKE